MLPISRDKFDVDFPMVLPFFLALCNTLCKLALGNIDDVLRGKFSVKDIDKVNRMFGLDISVKYRFDDAVKVVMDSNYMEEEDYE